MPSGYNPSSSLTFLLQQVIVFIPSLDMTIAFLSPYIRNKSSFALLGLEGSTLYLGEERLGRVDFSTRASEFGQHNSMFTLLHEVNEPSLK